MAGLIGVFGGTFDPPHWGHLVLADEARAVLGLERVLWVVAGVPPHKQGWSVTPPEVRVRLVEAAIRDNEAFVLSRVDLDRPGPHYTVDTLRLLRGRYPRSGLALILGSDSLADLPTWHRPTEILAQCEVLGVMRRPGAQVDLEALEKELPGLAKKVRFFEAPFIGVSGRDIRARVREGRPYRYLMPPAVLEVIEREGLYR